MAGGPQPTSSTEVARVSTADGDEPTDEEKQTLRKVSDKLPWSAFIVCVVELCERFTYYGLSGPFQNYIENPVGGSLPGAIGMGQTAATGESSLASDGILDRGDFFEGNHTANAFALAGLTDFFQFWCYVTPVIGAIVSDQYLGKYWTIFYSAIIYIVGCLILFLTSLPVAIENGAALGGLITAMIVIGAGTGGIKSNVSPLIAEQYQNTTPYIKTLKSGERVIVDPATTIKRICKFEPWNSRNCAQSADK